MQARLLPRHPLGEHAPHQVLVQGERGRRLLDLGRHVDGPRQRQPRLASTGTGGASAFSSRRLRL
ncbi:hypothetical protein [Streptomyces pseudogriseolus]|uniref:hypothetical protein n=1 Tax=Streptomyces pseudogriseolus TaxID=36817 RepID=UPI003479A712